MSPPTKRRKVRARISQAVVGLLKRADANKIVALAIAVLAAFGYSDNRARTAQAETHASQGRGRLTRRVDSLVVVIARRDSSIDSLRVAVARLKRSGLPAASVAQAPEPDEDLPEPGPSILGRVGQAGKQVGSWVTGWFRRG